MRNDCILKQIHRFFGSQRSVQELSAAATPYYEDHLPSGFRLYAGRTTDRVDWVFYAQFFNAFNRHRFTSINANADNATFGVPSGFSSPRHIQFGTRFLF